MIPFELAAIFSRLQLPASRLHGLAELATWGGASAVLLFCKDQTSGQFLPAPGLPQTLGESARWQAFLGSVPTGATASADLPAPTLPGPDLPTPDLPAPDLPAPDLSAPDNAADVPAHAVMDESGQVVMAFVGACPLPPQLQAIAALLPLLSALLAGERHALLANGHASAARDSNRRELLAAYERAEHELVFRRAAEARLRDADRRKDEFLAMLAHELRNPLAPISMAAQILKLGPVSPARLQQTCQIIERQVSHMTSLLDDLLDVSRVTRGLVALNKQQLDMRAIVDDALEQARPQINARGQHLVLNLPQQGVPVFGDRTRLVQIVTNLLNNATKYTPPGGNIALTVTETVTGGEERITLAVRDNGIGIDASLLGHVFDLFTQGERSPDRSQGGLGLGLALVKSLTERHGGAVAVHSAGAGLGSEFRVMLPRAGAPTEPHRPAPRPSERRDRARLSVLIVDDNADAARMLAMFLQAMGHEVRTAFDGHGALALARQRFPRVMLLDIGLPDMDGYALVGSLRALPGAGEALYIALTGYGQPEDRERSRQAGFDQHLTKPVDAQQLGLLLGQVQHLPQAH